MTTDGGMDAEELPIGPERTIMYLQRRIRMLQSMLIMAHGIIKESPNGCEHHKELQQIEKELSGVRFTSDSIPESS